MIKTVVPPISAEDTVDVTGSDEEIHPLINKRSMSYKKWKEFKFDKEVKKLMYFEKIEDYIAQPDPILVNSEEEALEDIHSRKVAQLRQLKEKATMLMLLNEIVQEVSWLNNHHLQAYRDE